MSVCVLLYYDQRRTISQVIRQGNSDDSAYRAASVGFKQYMFFAVFLIYPLITATLFRVPQCQNLGDDSFHEDDYNVDCTSGPFLLTVTFSVVMILVVPGTARFPPFCIALNAGQKLVGI